MTQSIGSRDEILEKLRSFIAEELLFGQDAGLDETTPLLEWGIIDSLTMVSFLAFIDEQLHVTVPDDEVRPENFQNLQSLTNLLLRITKEPEKGKDSEGIQKSINTGTVVQVISSYGVRPELVELPDSEQHILRVDGKKPAWVLIPALGTPSISWSEIMRSCVGEQEVIAIDLAGFGMSGPLKTETFTFADHINETAGVIDKVAQEPIVLIASSLGTMLATELIRRKRNLAKALIVLGFGLIEERQLWWDDFRKVSKNLDRFTHHAYFQPLSLGVQMKVLLDKAFSVPEYGSFLDKEGLEALGKTFDDINLPTLFISGKQDRIISKKMVEMAVSKIPSSKLEWIDECGHFPQMEKAAEVFSKIKDFLSSL